MTLNTVAVLGLGKIGALAATLLHEVGFQVTGMDNRSLRQSLPFDLRTVDLADPSQLDATLKDFDAVLSCLPYALNKSVAEIAHHRGVHYFDLTEDVPTTKMIQDLSTTAQAVMAPQCGLAPGLIGIVGAHLANGFETIRAIKLRVGALPQHPTGDLAYAFNWSPEGVVNEYLNDCEVIEDGQIKMVSPMEWLETLHINGMELEAFTTSGGLGTMCETFHGRAENLDYKTMRYPGHARLMNFFFHELLMREDRTKAGQILVNAKPPVSDDVVYIHASVEGHLDGRLSRKEFVKAYTPRALAGAERTAIAWTTAASVVSVIEMVRAGTLPQRGFIKQESIPFDAFSATTFGGLYCE